MAGEREGACGVHPAPQLGEVADNDIAINVPNSPIPDGAKRLDQWRMAPHAVRHPV